MNRFGNLVLLCTILAVMLGVDGQRNHFRLPNNTRPIGYDVTLTVDLDESKFFGEVQILLDALQESNYIRLNVKELEISNVKLSTSLGGEVLMNTWIMQNDSEIVTFNLESYLSVGQTYQLMIHFNGNIENDLKGLYKSSYYQGMEERFVATTFNAAAYARKIFPCYDEPHLKATFKLRIYHKAEFKALSNMPVEHRVEAANSANMSLTVFEQSPLMSSYLVAFVVSDFSALGQNEKIAVHAQSSVINSTRYALDFTKDAIEHLGAFFKRPYQLSKLDIVAIDDFLMGAMENWGLITYKTSRIVYQEGFDKTEKLQSVTKIIFHELIHQWFGNEVTCAWWSYVWLNEGFTVFLENYILDRMRPEWRLMDQFLVNDEHVVMEKDVLPSTHAMTKPINTPEEIEGIYDFVVYPKAASVIRMLQSVVGASIFDEFLVTYLADRSYKSSTEDDVFRVLQDVVDKRNMSLPPIQEVFKSWTNNPSYPVVTVNKDSANKATVTVLPAKTFYIPLKWLSESNKSGLEWITNMDNSKTIRFTAIGADEWILVNPDQYGYYRVNYDTNNWNKIISALKRDYSKIPVLSRAQLIDDALYLARDNSLDIEILFGLLDYLPQETDLIALKAGFNALRHLNRVFRGNDLYADYFDYQSRILEQVYDKMLLTKKDNHITKLYRAEVRKIACELAVPKCLQDAIGMFENFEHLDADLRASVICGSMKASESFNVWAIVLRRFVYIHRNFEQKRINLEEFEDLMYGFGCAVSRERLESYVLLSVSTHETVEQQDRIKMFNYVANSGVNGTDEALTRLINDYNTLKRRYESVTEIISNLGNAISTPAQLQQFTTFMQNNTDTSIINILHEVYNKAQINIRWATTNLPAISRWISTKSLAVRFFTSKALILISLITFMCHLK